MVAHDAMGRTGRNHAPYQVHRVHLLRTTVDEVADENGRAPAMPPGAVGLAVTEMREQGNQFFKLTMDVADDIEFHQPPAGQKARAHSRSVPTCRSTTLDNGS